MKRQTEKRRNEEREEKVSSVRSVRIAFGVLLIFICYASAEFVIGDGFRSVRGAMVRFLFFLAATLIVLRLSGAHDREKRLARTDHKTGIANDRRFFELAASEMKRAHRFNRPLTVSYMDIDNFKAINDSFGHREGDLLLKGVAQTVESCIRSFDLVARLGGDEFVLLLPETDSEAARAVFIKIREQLRGLVAKRGWPVTFSFGVVTCKGGTCALDSALSRADQLLYEVKGDGKDSIKFLELIEEPVAA